MRKNTTLLVVGANGYVAQQLVAAALFDGYQFVEETFGGAVVVSKSLNRACAAGE